MKIALSFLVAVLIATAGVCVMGSTSVDMTESTVAGSSGGSGVVSTVATNGTGGEPAATTQAPGPEVTTAGAVVIRSNLSVAVMVVAVAACLRLSM